MKIRELFLISRGISTRNGAGIVLTRTLGNPTLRYLDPFLLLEELRGSDPGDCAAESLPHPHRGIEIVTYMKEGRMRHHDSHGNSRTVAAGDVQWITAGRGIIHREVPEPEHGSVWGYQLWINLPAKLKLVEPRCQNFTSGGIPTVNEQAMRLKAIAGEIAGIRGPAESRLSVLFFDVELVPGGSFRHHIPQEMNGFCFIYDGSLITDTGGERREVAQANFAALGNGDDVLLKAGKDGARFLLAAGNRIGEPIARAGPFVMTTQEELYQAFEDYREGRLAPPYPPGSGRGGEGGSSS